MKHTRGKITFQKKNGKSKHTGLQKALKIQMM